MLHYNTRCLVGLGLILSAASAHAASKAREQLEDIDVVAERPAGPPALMSTSFLGVDVARQSDSIARGATTLGEALGALPGVATTGYAPGAASRPILRGATNAQVRIQENGTTTGDVSTMGEDHAVVVNPLTATNVEILRGPQALRFGGQIVGGIIEASDGRIAETRMPGLRTSLYGAQATNSARDGALRMQAGGENLVVTADTFARQADDYRTPLGVQRNSAASARGVGVGASYIFDQGFFGASFDHTRSDYRIPGFFAADNRTRIAMERWKISTRGEYRPTGGFIEAIRFWGAYSNYRHDEKGIDPVTGFDGVRGTFKNREFETRLEARHRVAQTPFGALSGAIGVQWGQGRLGAGGEANALIAPAITRTLALYGYEKLELSPQTRLEGALRIESVRIAGTPMLFPAGLTPPGEPAPFAASRSFTPFSTSLALSHDIEPGLTAALTASHTERAPQALELFARGAHDASGSFEIGDPNLKKESANSIEAALRKTDGAFRFELRGYATFYRNFIHRRLTGVLCDDDFESCGAGAELKQVIYAQRSATFLGLEAKAAYDFAEIGGGVASVEAQYDLVRARFSDGTNVPFMPPQRLGGGLAWRDAHWLARWSLTRAFAQNATAPTETRTPGHFLMNAEIRYTHALAENPFGFKTASFSVVGNNLLNARIRNATSLRKDEVLAPGRNVRFVARFDF